MRNQVEGGREGGRQPPCWPLPAGKQFCNPDPSLSLPGRGPSADGNGMWVRTSPGWVTLPPAQAGTRPPHQAKRSQTEKREAGMSSWRPEPKHSPGGLPSQLSGTLFLLLLSMASAQEVTAKPAACLVSHSVNGSSVSCHPPAPVPHRFPADTVYLVVEFFNLTQLRDDALQGLTRLQELHLSSNRLESLSPKFLLPAPRLQVLDLTNNALPCLPPGLFRASAALHTLVLKANRLQGLEPSWLQGLKGLRHLDLSENRLQTLPPGLLANLSSLLVLDLSDNQLKALPPDLLEGPLQLERLRLDGNRLQVLEEGLLAPQPDLGYLFLNDNELASVAASAFRGLRRLDMLDLSNNSLTGVPEGLWASLGRPTRDMEDGFDISGNPWICDESLEDLRRWLEANQDKMFSRNATRCAGPEVLKGRMLLTAAESP